MIRAVLTEVAVFLIPFAAFAVFLIVSRSAVLHRDSWSLRVIGWLTVVALALVLISLLLLAHFEGAPPGSTYVPAHLENGRLVPGAEQPGGAK
ncbi:DUF6111 family protein [Rhodopseudomonas sp. B29]|uniref:DUF6111 family protein n=1 Tax=Rhodopseudomonas sp. B29 TaxID=95607 RepID=UPI00034C4522|nr:DUF6111 family protein [Rhodopseudomonas sp. B29]